MKVEHPGDECPYSQNRLWEAAKKAVAGDVVEEHLRQQRQTAALAAVAEAAKAEVLPFAVPPESPSPTRPFKPALRFGVVLLVGIGLGIGGWALGQPLIMFQKAEPTTPTHRVESYGDAHARIAKETATSPISQKRDVSGSRRELLEILRTFEKATVPSIDASSDSPTLQALRNNFADTADLSKEEHKSLTELINSLKASQCLNADR